MGALYVTGGEVHKATPCLAFFTLIFENSDRAVTPTRSQNITCITISIIAATIALLTHFPLCVLLFSLGFHPYPRLQTYLFFLQNCIIFTQQKLRHKLHLYASCRPLSSAPKGCLVPIKPPGRQSGLFVDRISHEYRLRYAHRSTTG